MLSIFQTFKFKSLFRLFDKNGNGTIDQTDFEQIFSDMVTDGDEAKLKHAATAAKRWWLSLKLYGDKDKDKTVTQEEFLAWAAGAMKSRAFARWVDALFDAIANGDNLVTAAEFQGFADALGFGEQADAIYFVMDVNDDGAIDRKEFTVRMEEFFTGDITPGNFLFGNLFSK